MAWPYLLPLAGRKCWYDGKSMGQMPRGLHWGLSFNLTAVWPWPKALNLLGLWLSCCRMGGLVWIVSMQYNRLPNCLPCHGQLQTAGRARVTGLGPVWFLFCFTVAGFYILVEQGCSSLFYLGKWNPRFFPWNLLLHHSGLVRFYVHLGWCWPPLLPRSVFTSWLTDVLTWLLSIPQHNWKRLTVDSSPSLCCAAFQ